MGRRRQRFSPGLDDAQLERRALLSQAPAPATAAAVGSVHAGERNLFHQNGINGLDLHRTFVNQLNSRLTISKDQTTRIIQAFGAFKTSYGQLTVNPQPGAMVTTLAGLVATLKQQVATAEIRRELATEAPTLSEQRSITISPLAPVALVPFSEAQIDKMAATLAEQPPVSGPNGALAPADPTAAMNTAVNAILNAMAETSVHPLLFLKPVNFYLNPNIKFTLSFSGTPAQAAPGFFIRGPHGTILPGATLHPFAPN
jgi:hypothetical protein